MLILSSCSDLETSSFRQVLNSLECSVFLEIQGNMFMTIQVQIDKHTSPYISSLLTFSPDIVTKGTLKSTYLYM